MDIATSQCDTKKVSWRHNVVVCSAPNTIGNMCRGEQQVRFRVHLNTSAMIATIYVAPSLIHDKWDMSVKHVINYSFPHCELEVNLKGVRFLLVHWDSYTCYIAT